MVAVAVALNCAVAVACAAALPEVAEACGVELLPLLMLVLQW